MPQYVVLLRGINVGGHGRLPMTQLRGVMQALGATDVATYIQSGNVVCQHPETRPRQFETDLSAAIEREAGFAPRVLVLRKREFLQAVKANPFPDAEAEQDGKALHLSFLAAKPKALDPTQWEAAAGPGESFRLIDKVLYLHAPQGLSRSKLAPKIETWLGVSATARNWRTVARLAEMLATD